MSQTRDVLKIMIHLENEDGTIAISVLPIVMTKDQDKTIMAQEKT